MKYKMIETMKCDFVLHCKNRQGNILPYIGNRMSHCHGIIFTSHNSSLVNHDDIFHYNYTSMASS